MRFTNSLKLQGKFKIDVFDSGNNLKFTTDYFDNFITAKGLDYAKTFAFADCFRYLSLGDSNTQNSLTSNAGQGTLGLSSQVSAYQYIGGNDNNLCNESVKSNQYVAKGCGYRTHSSGVTLLRAWRVPKGEDYFDAAYTFREYMLSPGRPYITGYEYDSDNDNYNLEHKICSCEDFATYSIKGDNSSAAVYGEESSDFYSVYSTACDSVNSFTRVVKDVVVAKNDYLIVNYYLNVNYITGDRWFGGIADTTSVPPYTRVGHPEDTYNWTRPSGKYNIVHPGIKLINDGNIVDVYPGGMNNLDLTVDGVGRVGESFIPPLGNPFDPYISESSKFAYLTSDCFQFIVNDIDGGFCDTSVYKPFNAAGRDFPKGLMGFNKDWITDSSFSTDVLGEKITQSPQFFSPRSEITASNFASAYASQSDYTQPANASDINDSVNMIDGKFTPITIQSVSISESFDSATALDRTRTKTISIQFKDPNISSDLEPILDNDVLPIRGMVYGYTYNNFGTSEYYPAMDALFIPTGGSIVPAVGTAPSNLTYADPLGTLTTSPKKGYNFFDQNNLLEVRLKLSWSSDCPSSVVGC